MGRKTGLLALFFFTVITDQASKALVHSTFDLYQTRDIIGSLLMLRYIRNPGGAFGLNPGHPVLMLVLTLAVLGILLWIFFRSDMSGTSPLMRTGMVLVIGGAVGNLIDRIRMREVIDFIDMGLGIHRWPVYNLADVYVTFGIAILILSFLRSPDNVGPTVPPHEP